MKQTSNLSSYLIIIMIQRFHLIYHSHDSPLSPVYTWPVGSVTRPWPLVARRCSHDCMMCAYDAVGVHPLMTSTLPFTLELPAVPDAAH